MGDWEIRLLSYWGKEGMGEWGIGRMGENEIQGSFIVFLNDESTPLAGQAKRVRQIYSFLLLFMY